MAAPPQEEPPSGRARFAVPDAGLDGEVEVTGFVDQAADFTGRLGDVDQQRVPATGNVLLGHEGLFLVSHGAGPL
jgi:hypothetical protein